MISSSDLLQTYPQSPGAGSCFPMRQSHEGGSCIWLAHQMEGEMQIPPRRACFMENAHHPQPGCRYIWRTSPVTSPMLRKKCCICRCIKAHSQVPHYWRGEGALRTQTGGELRFWLPKLEWTTFALGLKEHPFKQRIRISLPRISNNVNSSWARPSEGP